ncbi:hypothetical protein M086_0374, partial [Bacteroides fragilis str. S13 L11]
MTGYFKKCQQYLSNLFSEYTSLIMISDTPL